MRQGFRPRQSRSKMKQETNLIGSIIKVIGSQNKTQIGITGKVVDETKNSIVVYDGKNKKRLLRNEIKIIKYGDKK